MRKALTIAGSDSGGGAGIQADLKTFHRFGVFGTSALTLITAQNTLGVQGIHLLPPEVIAAQIASVASDLRPDAVKTGAMGSASIVEGVAEALRRHELRRLVVDPVIVSRRGDRLVDDDAVEALETLLFPKADLLTPNLHEARALVRGPIDTVEAMEEAARALADRGPRAVVIKGGAMEGPEAIDVLWDGERIHRLVAPRIDTTSTHGTGCTFSAAIAAQLALGHKLVDAVREAKAWTHRAIAAAPGLGAGSGPVDHGVA